MRRVKKKSSLLYKSCCAAVMLSIFGMAVGASPASAISQGYQANDGSSVSLQSTGVFNNLDGTSTTQEYSYYGYQDRGNVAVGNFSQAEKSLPMGAQMFRKDVFDEITDLAGGYDNSIWDNNTHSYRYYKRISTLEGYQDENGNLYEFAGFDANTNSYQAYELNADYTRKGEETVSLPSPYSSGNNTAIGNGAEATGGYSAALGASSKAKGIESIAVGNNSQSYGWRGVAVGVNAMADTTRAIAIGEGAKVAYDENAASDPQRLIAEQAIAIGYNSEANGKDATAVGRQARADRRNASAFGNNSHANAYNSVAIGNKAIAGLKEETDENPIAGQSAVAVGNRATATQEFTTAVGASTFASGWHAVAVGDSNRATGRFSTAMGAGWSEYTVDEDDNDNTEKPRVYSNIGANQSTGDYSTGVGYGNASLGENSSTFGMQNVASGVDSLAYGSRNKVGNERNVGDTSLQGDAPNVGDITGFAVGTGNEITGHMGGAFGGNNLIRAERGFGVGNNIDVAGKGGFGAGNGAQVTEAGENSMAIGNDSRATLPNSVALGSGAKTNEVVGTSVVEIPGTNTPYSNIAGTNPVGTVSVGDAGAERTITNVAAGRIGPGSTDAVNGSELYAVAQEVGNNSLAINNLNNRINRLDNKINRIGAGAAALAMLHPLDFDPDEKWDFAAGWGHYGNKNAVALGAFYRPNEDTMFSLGGVIGDGEKMIAASVSWKFGQKNHVSVNRVASAKEIIEIRKELDDLRSFAADMVSGNILDLSKIQLFPDIPENHWAYDYVSTLAGNGILEGYPDGYFDGHRSMTRYEMAAVLYRAMLRGIKLKERALREFAPELDRIRVDTITWRKDGSPAIQRVRTIPGKGC